MAPATGLTIEQVLLEAKSYWFRTEKTNSTRYDPPGYGPKLRPMGFSAFNALRKVELEDYPDDPFWETANMEVLESTLKSLIDADLVKSNSSYDKEMLVRDGFSHLAARHPVKPA